MFGAPGARLWGSDPGKFVTKGRQAPGDVIVSGDGGTIVPVQDPGAFERALRALADLRPEERRQIGAADRRRAARDFSFVVMSLRYEAIYREAAETAAGPAPVVF